MVLISSIISFRSCKMRLSLKLSHLMGQRCDHLLWAATLPNDNTRPMQKFLIYHSTPCDEDQFKDCNIKITFLFCFSFVFVFFFFMVKYSTYCFLIPESDSHSWAVCFRISAAFSPSSNHHFNSGFRSTILSVASYSYEFNIY